jgi:hypothetical protein
MKIVPSKLVALLLVLAASPLCAKPTTFLNHGLKYTTLVTLDVSGKTASGTYVSYDEEPGPATPFTGKVIPTPKGKRGVYLEIQFPGEPPYNVPPGGALRRPPSSQRHDPTITARTSVPLKSCWLFPLWRQCGDGTHARADRNPRHAAGSRDRLRFQAAKSNRTPAPARIRS